MLPNCIVIGAPRSGTTSLYEYLSAHPDVYMSPVKEPDFFSLPSLDASHGAGEMSPELKADLDWYTALFEKAGNEKIRGEASAIYLGHPTAAQHIRDYVPDAKLVAVLRDPAERAHSHFVHAQRIRAEFDPGATTGTDGRTLQQEFADAVDEAYRNGYSEPARTEPQIWIRSGFYHQHVTRFQSIFPAEQLRLFLYEDLVQDSQLLMKEIYGFLGVDDSFVLPTTEAFNASVVPRRRGVFRFFTTRNPAMRYARAIAPARLRGLAVRTRNRLLGGAKPEIDTDLRHKLVSIYHDDIVKLQDLLGRDLSAWLEVSR